jgi:serine/threonine-protein kinase RsbW
MSRMNAAQPISFPSPDSAQVRVLNLPSDVEGVQNMIVEAASRYDYPKASLFALRLSLQEAITNAFRHGHRHLTKDAPITVDFSVTRETIQVAIEDQGPGFDPASIPDPTLEPNLETPSGRGLFLIRAYMKSVRYNDRGNRIEMVYANPKA